MGCSESTASGAGRAVTPPPAKEVKEGGFDHAAFVWENPGKICDFYDLEKRTLGISKSGSVSKAKAKQNGVIRAVKSVAKKRLKSMDHFKREVGVLKMMDHPNIIKLYEVFEDHYNIYLVMELCTGGELFDKITAQGRSLKEPEVAGLMQQILRAVFYMHDSHICHRDLKPENFLFLNKEPLESNVLKIVDFGEATTFESGQVFTTKEGSPYYVAPQVLAGKYDYRCDMWSCGVLMYVMLCGYPPFYGESDEEIFAKIRYGHFQYSPADWKNVSEDAKELINGLLRNKPEDRYTAEEALSHPWVKKQAPQAREALSEAMIQNLRNFRAQNKLKKAAMHVIASRLNEKQIKKLRQAFLSLDKNSDGFVTPAEMKEGMTAAGLTDIPVDLQQILEDVDSDGSGRIDYTEFLAATMDRRLYVKEDAVWSAFRAFDRNGDGKISTEELRAVLANDHVKEMLGDADEMETVMRQVDTNGDEVIDFEEFMVMMKEKVDNTPPPPLPPTEDAEVPAMTALEAKHAEMVEVPEPKTRRGCCGAR